MIGKRYLSLLGFAGVTMLVAMTGCSRRPTALTYIPGQTRTITNDIVYFPEELAKPLTATNRQTSVVTQDMNDATGGVPQADRAARENMDEDRAVFNAYTVLYDFDRAAVKTTERKKVESVATALKQNAETKVEVEGHCDERGTEEYNRSLGERRALAVREYLIMLGISAERVYTKSFGEDRPADPAHNDKAWAKNRRAEFILLTPKK
jgi:peptidoglycan-associated lipoprotein